MANAIDVLRSQFSLSLDWLEGAIADVDDDALYFNPPGAPSPIAGQIAHIVTGADYFILGAAAGGQPLMAGEYAGKTGMSELPPQGPWNEWGDRVRINLPEIQAYTKAVFGAIDGYLASMTDDDLDAERDYGAAGTNTVAWALNIILLNTYSHVGEISCIKGLQGIKGYAL